MAKTYSASMLKVLEGLDAVRMRPGMYIGSTGARGLHHLLWEIVDNAIDEVANGYARSVRVELHKDGSASVEDDGRGVPVDIHPELGITGVEMIYTKLHAGGKFDHQNYNYSGGLHGVGASVVNALSKWLVVDSCTGGGHYRMRFESNYDPKEKKIASGRPVTALERVSATRRHGTRVTFLPDDTVFEETRFNSDTVRRRLRELAYLNRGLEITFIDEREKDPEKQQHVFLYEGGLTDYVKYLNRDKTPVYENIIMLEGMQEDVRICLAIQHTDDYSESIFSYVNNIPTAEGGTHEMGFKAGFTRALNDYARRIGALKEKDNNLMGEDYREGITAVLLTFVRNPQFEGQTKGKLGNTEVRPAVEAFVYARMTEYLENLKNQDVAQGIVEKAVRASKVREAARKAKEVARAKNSWRPRRWWASSPAAPARSPSSTRCLSSRAIPQAAAPSRAATAASRRFCRFAASRSTWRRSALIRCWPTRSSAPSSRRWAPASARISTSRRSSTTRSSSSRTPIRTVRTSARFCSRSSTGTCAR